METDFRGTRRIARTALSLIFSTALFAYPVCTPIYAAENAADTSAAPVTAAAGETSVTEGTRTNAELNAAAVSNSSQTGFDAAAAGDQGNTSASAENNAAASDANGSSASAEDGSEGPGEAGPVAADDWLPIGSVVLLNGGAKTLLIIGRVVQNATDEKIYDYCACYYPEGYFGDTMYFFNQPDIALVCFRGYENEYETLYRQQTLDGLDVTKLTVVDGQIVPLDE